MRRREFLGVLGSAAAWPVVARAQQGERMRRVGYLTPSRPVPHLLGQLRDALSQLGWIEGKNIVFELRHGENNVEALARKAAELVQLNVDLIMAAGTLGPLAAKRATTTIPIVMTSSGDPVGSGLVDSLPRPGGNVTGVSLMAPDLGGKRLEILREMQPSLSRVTVLWNATNPYSAIVFRETENAAQRLGVEVHSVEVRGSDKLEHTFEVVLRHKPGALITVEDPLTFGYRAQIAEFATKNQLLSIFGLREYVDAGGLLAYGAHLADLHRRAAGYVDKILRGTKPADLPVEQPTKFELAINLKTAKALGLTIPPTLLARADEVIE